jgi:hypothetical protein
VLSFLRRLGFEGQKCGTNLLQTRLALTTVAQVAGHSFQGWSGGSLEVQSDSFIYVRQRHADTRKQTVIHDIAESAAV